MTKLIGWVREKLSPDDHKGDIVGYRARYAEIVFTQRRQQEISNRLKRMEVEAEIMARKRI
jgi:hypothetical protein